jgi:hypothetical protein
MRWTLASQIGPSHRRFGRWSLRSAREEPDVDAQLTRDEAHYPDHVDYLLRGRSCWAQSQRLSDRQLFFNQ